MNRRYPVWTALVAALALALAACSSPPEPTATADGEPTIAQTDGITTEPTVDADGDESPDSDKDEDGTPDATGDDSGHDKEKSEDKDSDGPRESGEPAAYPAPGTYLFDQTGYEEFCQATQCDRHNLPPTQEVRSAVKQRTERGAIVVSEAQSSNNSLVRTTTKFTPEVALITEVYFRVTYQGFSYSNTYRPKPPVEALRFPMEVGESWSGEWEAQTSGDYRIEVVARERVRAGDRTVTAFKIETHTDFRGELEGTSDAVLWIDPETKAIVKSLGEMRVRSAFGRYNTEFQIVLRSGPGYE